jgi:signal transduction histidine kinase
VGEIIQRVVDYMHRRTSNKVRMTTDLPADPVIVPLVASLFEWVLENLCKNAVDAMSGSGSIDIHLSETDAQAIIEVHDTGKGMDAKEAAEAMAPFDGERTTKELLEKGRGLHIVRNTVQMMNGQLQVVTTPGQGTEVILSLTLPLAPK